MLLRSGHCSHTHPLPPTLFQSLLHALLPPWSVGLMEGSNEKQAYANPDSSKHRKEPEAQACFIKGWK